MNITKLFLISIFSCLTAFFAAASETPDHCLEFAVKDGKSLYMDIYRPREHNILSAKPSILYIYGGGFTDGNKRDKAAVEWFHRLTDKGYSVIAIEYRHGLAGTSTTIPSEFVQKLSTAIYMGVEDLFCATGYLLNYGKKYGIDPYNIVICGSSAGAIIALQAEYEISRNSPSASSLPDDFNYKGVMAYAGAILDKGSKIEFGRKICPIMMFHGTQDELVPYSKITAYNHIFAGSDYIAGILSKSGVPHKIFRYEGEDHSVAGYMSETIDKQIEFIDMDITGYIGKKKEVMAYDGKIYWRPNTYDQGITWVIDRNNLPHEDHIEMSGKKVSCVLRWGVDTNGHYIDEKSLVFPCLRTIPNNTHGSLAFRIGTAIPSLINVNGRTLFNEKVDSVTINGYLKVSSRWSYTEDVIGMDRKGNIRWNSIKMERTVFPSTEKPAVCEKIVITNLAEEAVRVYIPEFSQIFKTDASLGVDGAYTIQCTSSGNGISILNQNESKCFYLVYQAYRANEKELKLDVEIELEKRKAFINDTLDNNLILETPDTVINRMFRFAKIRASESIYETKGGPMHGPGGETYYAAVWANDQAEYINPFFPFLGYDYANKSAFNSFMMFSRYLSPDYKAIPSSIIAEGEDIWNGCGDRGDAAMIAYGASRYALARGSREEAENLWPLITWCLEYCQRNLNKDGVVMSDTDELENRFESGNANLCTSVLYYDALISATYLAKELGKPTIKINSYRKSAMKIKKSIEAYFGGNVSGYETYRYYDGNTLLRSWICMPLIAGITDRKDGTIAALTGPELMTSEGCLTEQGSEVFWDRSTLYALRGIFYAGETNLATEFLHNFSKKRLLGDHVPYAIEAWPEGSQRHLSAESGLFCRVITEGLFGIRPTGFNTFEINATLPYGWNKMSLKNIKAFGSSFNIIVERNGNGKTVIKTEKTEN